MTTYGEAPTSVKIRTQGRSVWTYPGGGADLRPRGPRAGLPKEARSGVIGRASWIRAQPVPIGARFSRERRIDCGVRMNACSSVTGAEGTVSARKQLRAGTASLIGRLGDVVGSGATNVPLLAAAIEAHDWDVSEDAGCFVALVPVFTAMSIDTPGVRRGGVRRGTRGRSAGRSRSRGTGRRRRRSTAAPQLRDAGGCFSGRRRSRPRRPR